MFFCTVLVLILRVMCAFHRPFLCDFLHISTVVYVVHTKSKAIPFTSINGYNLNQFIVIIIGGDGVVVVVVAFIRRARLTVLSLSFSPVFFVMYRIRNNLFSFKSIVLVI